MEVDFDKLYKNIDFAETISNLKGLPIKRITKTSVLLASESKEIKAFGFLKNDGTVPEFKKSNLIYGWNYSGKTVLSRVFRCLENGGKHPDFRMSEFEFETPETK